MTWRGPRHATLPAARRSPVRGRRRTAPAGPLPAALIVLAALCPVAALAADAVCRFDLECVDADPCAGTDFELRLSAPPASETAPEAGSGSAGADGIIRPPRLLRLDSIADSVTGEIVVAAPGMTRVLALGPSGARLLSIAADGAARYMLHPDDGSPAITYLGSCR